MPEFKIENPKHIARAFPEMEASFPRLYRALEWDSGYSFAGKPNEIQSQFLAFVANDRDALRLDLLAALAALQVVASPGATDADRERALALVGECEERWGLADSFCEDSSG